MIDISHAYLVARDDAHADFGALGLGVDRPSIPGTWTFTAEADGWFEAVRADGERAVAFRANTLGARMLYAVFARLPLLQALATIETQLCAPAIQVWNAAQGGNVPAQSVARRWPYYVITGAVRRTQPGGTTTFDAVTNACVRLIPFGATLPAWPFALPLRLDAAGNVVATDGAAQVRVDSFSRPGIACSVAGFTLDATLRDEP